MRTRSNTLANKSLQIAMSAIEIYNKPNFLYREETFSILMINAWELLLKAKLLSDNANKLNILYREALDGKHKYKQNRSGNNLTKELLSMVSDFKNRNLIDENCVNNIYSLTEIRDNAIHFFSYSTKLAQIVLELGSASLKNYNYYLSCWFKIDLSKYNLFLMPISFVDVSNVKENISKNSSFSNFINYISSLHNLHTQQNNHTSYMIKVNYTYIKSNSLDAIRVNKSKDGIPVTITEEDLATMYPLSCKTLCEKAKLRYSDFKQNADFYSILNPLKQNQSFSRTRLSNVHKKDGAKQYIYNDNIFQELDKHYTKK